MSSDNGLDDLYRSILDIEVKEITDVNNKIQKIRDLYLLLQRFVHDYMQGIPDVINPQGIIDDYIHMETPNVACKQTEENSNIEKNIVVSGSSMKAIKMLKEINGNKSSI